MPIYEYRCSSCGFQKEFLQKMSDPLLTTCPSCSKETLGKMVTAAGFQLKGSGWYVTDFRNNGDKASGKAGGVSASAEGPSSESKPADSGAAKAEPAAASTATAATPASTTASTPAASSTPSTT